MHKKRVHLTQTQTYQQKRIIVRKGSKQKTNILKKDKPLKIDCPDKHSAHQDNIQSIKFVNNRAILKSQSTQSDKRDQAIEFDAEQYKKVRTPQSMAVSSQNNLLRFKKSKTEYFSNPQNGQLYFSTQNKTFQDKNKQILQMKSKIHQQNIKLLTQKQEPFKNLISQSSQAKQLKEIVNHNKSIKNQQFVTKSEDHHEIGCIQCRYHLQKQNIWANIKIQLQNKIQELQNKLNLINNTKEQLKMTQSTPQKNKLLKYDKSTTNSNQSIQKSKQPHQIQQNQFNKIQVNQERFIIQLLNLQIQQKNKQIDILSGQLVASEFTITHLKQKLHELNENLKYLSIQNRTLLKMKTQIMKFQLQNIKLTQQRDSFKKKMIQISKANIKLQKQLKVLSVGNNKWKKEESSCSESLQQSLISLSPQTQSLEHSFVDQF